MSMRYQEFAPEAKKKGFEKNSGKFREVQVYIGKFLLTKGRFFNSKSDNHYLKKKLTLILNNL